jgi:hypothetical protein
LAVGTDADKIAWSDEMSRFYNWKDSVDFFGLAVDTTGNLEDTLHNEMYFDQFLAWFGVSLMSGTWVNVAALLDTPVSNTEGIPGYPSEAKPSSSSVAPSSSSNLQNNQSSSSFGDNNSNSSSSLGNSASSSSSNDSKQTPIAICANLKNLQGNAKIEVYNLRGEKQTIPIQTKGLYIVKIRYENSHTEILKVTIK